MAKHKEKASDKIPADFLILHLTRISSLKVDSWVD